MIAHVLALALVTATVTSPGGGTGGAQAAQSGEYQVVITNNLTRKSLVWQRHTYPDQNRCDAAIKGVNATLASIALMKLGPSGEVIGAMIPAPDADDELAASVDALLNAIVQNTGTFPNLSISCETQADPA